MSLVLDGSTALAWCFEDEATAEIDALFDHIAERGAHVPSIWRLEVANGLQSAIRRKRIDAAYRDLALSRLMAQRVTVDPETDRHAWSATVRLAERHDLTIYDASYLELALRLGLPLATADKALVSAARNAGLPQLKL